ncbi:MAG TPA: acyl-CoA dehydrogenase family protein [Acidimicrobiales bacterium]|nr:acyl-CoA dehydrogenase family protein [Acidimicrobiales bacterium]
MTKEFGDTSERAQLRDTVRRLIADVAPADRVARLDEAERFDDQLYEALGRVDAFAVGLTVGDIRDQLVIIEELAAGPTSMAAFMISHYAAVALVVRLAIEPEARVLADRALRGEARIAFALSEPDGGTDVARAMQTRAERTADGFRIVGTKLWTSGALEADATVVFARTSPPQRSAVDGITMLLVRRGAPGLSVRPVPTLGIRGLSTCEVVLDGVEAPLSAVLGDVDAGLRTAFRTISGEGLHAAAASIGVGRGALALAVQHAKDRLVFGRPVGAFQVPQHWLVDGAVALEAARALLVRAAEVEAGGGDAWALASMAKLAASEAAVQISLRGMQMMGGLGYSREVAMQRYFRDARLWSFSPLTNEMVRNMLGERFLGLPRSY